MSANVYKSGPLGGTSFSETCVARWGAIYRSDLLIEIPFSNQFTSAILSFGLSRQSRARQLSECRRTLFRDSLFSSPDARLQGPREPLLPCKFLKTITFCLWHRRGHRFDPDQSTNAAESSKGTRLRFSCSSESGFHAVRTDASPD
jgi:hypothetical protein